jgi:hypothetical protein
MKYLLVVGFACNVYRQEPRVRIFVGDKLIDEFYITHHKDTLTTAIKNFRQNKHILQPFSTTEYINLQTNFFPPLRFYEIDIDQPKDQLKLHIDIDNNDSNYTNGFITESTLLQLQVFYFFPLNKELLSRLNKIMIKNRTSKNYNYIRCEKNIIFNLVSKGLRWHDKEQGFNQQFDKNLWKDQVNIGGSGYFTCELVKKYGIFISKLPQSYRYHFYSMLIDYFLNKYKQHANQ